MFARLKREPTVLQRRGYTDANFPFLGCGTIAIGNRRVFAAHPLLDGRRIDLPHVPRPPHPILDLSVRHCLREPCRVLRSRYWKSRSIASTTRIATTKVIRRTKRWGVTQKCDIRIAGYSARSAIAGSARL